MAKISITFSGVVHYTDATNKVESKDDITLATDKVGCDAFLAVDEPATKFLKYSMNIKDFSFQKKMYQPTEFIVTLGIASEKSSYQDINRKAIEKLFKYKQVGVKDAESTFSEGLEFYVHEVQPVYAKGSEMVVILKICSLDKLMTLQQVCRTFVGKKLGEDILATETKKYIKPWTIAETNNQADLEKEESIAYTTNMRILEYETGKEHIFPYLVQYNESFYDLLARTTNRWGEFMYFENDKLHIGYKNAAPTQVSKDAVKNITFYHIDTKKLKLATDGVYDYEADSSNLDAQPIQESPNYVKGQMGAFGGEADKWIMDQFPSIFMNEDNLPTMMGNMLFENVFNLAKEESKEAKRNAKHNKKYFKDFNATSPQYSESYEFERDDGEKVKKRAFQEFTEINTSFTREKYENILYKEQTTGRDAIYIDYDTRHPNLRLGDIVSFTGENYIVVEVKGGFDAAQNLVFMVVATAQNEDKLFYPAVIPAGHVRHAHPQIATITDATDPTKVHRARVRFSWETIKYDNKGNITEDTKEISSPWLTFASAQQGFPMAGKHYEGDRVMVGFEDGNVERPYIIGGLVDQECDEFNIDAILSSQGMHQLILTDGSGAGMQSFLTGALSPLTKTLMGFAPGLIPSWKWEKDKYFEGGFELTDNYGTYKISGSTNGRNVSIASNWGDVKIDAFTGISISAPNGDVKISGKNVTIEAGNNLNLISGKNVDYKLWKSKESAKSTASQCLMDMSILVAKRLAEVALNVFDLSLVRSTVEIFFRPVEGSLTVKSNRFLKLEAGNSNCRLPLKAYNRVEKKKLLDKVNQKTASKYLEQATMIATIFYTLERVVQSYASMYHNSWDGGHGWMRQLGPLIKDLEKESNDPTGITEKHVCYSYDDLEDQLWSQKEDKDWGEEMLGFSDNVAIKGDPNEIVTFASVYNHPDYRPNQPKSADKEIRWDRINRRKELRKQILDCCQYLRKDLYDLTHMNPSMMEKRIEDIYRDEAERCKNITNKEIPADYKQKIMNAISKERCPNALVYDIPDFSTFMYQRGNHETAEVKRKLIYFGRMAGLNLLEEFGLTDDMRKPIRVDDNAPSQIPVKPHVGNIDDNDENSIMNDKCWHNFISSVQLLPLIEGPEKNALVSALSSTWEAQKEKLNFWEGAEEIKTWGEGKEGQILFGSGYDTYALNHNKFERVKSLNDILTFDERYGDEGLRGMNQEIRGSLESIGRS